MSRNNKIAVQVLGLCVAAVMIIYGVSRGETAIRSSEESQFCRVHPMWKMCGIMPERITGFEVRIWKKGIAS